MFLPSAIFLLLLVPRKLPTFGLSFTQIPWFVPQSGLPNMSVIHKVAFSVDPAIRSFLPRIGYVLDFLSNHPNAPAEGVSWQLVDHPSMGMIPVRYGHTSPQVGFHVPAQGVIFQHLPITGFLLAPKCYDFGESALFSVEKLTINKSANTPFLLPSVLGSTHFGFDWVETLFFHLSRLEEYQAGPKDLDEHGTLPAYRQFLPRHGLHHRPVVDHLVSAIYRAIGLVPQQRPTAWTITHDIDHIRFFSPRFRLYRYLGGLAYRHRSLRGWWPLLRQYRACRWQGAVDPYLSFEWLFAENPHLERIVYLAAMHKAPHALDPGYRLEEPAIRMLWDRAAKLGYTLGLHPSYQTWRDADRFQAEWQHLQQWSGTTVRHTRQHYLRFAFPATPDIIEQAGVADDSTLGYRDRIGFRCGTGFAYHLYNFAREKRYTWLEKPLIVMDIGLLREAGFQAHTLTNLWTRFIQANQTGTHITINFHNSVFFEPELHGLPLRNLYLALLDSLPNSQ